MYYQFNERGECESSCTGKVEPEAGMVSVWCEEIYTDIENLRLVNGKVVYVG